MYSPYTAHVRFWSRVRLRSNKSFSHSFFPSLYCIFKLSAFMRVLQKMPHKLFAYPLENLLIHLILCLTLGSKPLRKRALHVVRSRASSFKWEYILISLRSSSSFLRLLPCLPVTSIPPFIFSSITRCRRQFLRKIWPIQFAFRLRISCRIFLDSK
jgi:hypothetical protein